MGGEREVGEGGGSSCQETETLTDQWLTLALKSLAIISSSSTTLFCTLCVCLCVCVCVCVRACV